MRYLTIVCISLISAATIYFSLTLSLAPAPISAEYWVREMLIIKRSIVQKYNGQRKIIIASGSSGLFCIDTKQLGDELKIPVLNLALHAGLPLKTILGEAESASEKDDTIILHLEFTYYCIKEPTNWQARNTIAWDRERWEAMPILDRIKAITLLGPSIILELVEAKARQAFLPKSIADRLTALDDKTILAKFASSPEPITFAYSAYHLDPLGNMRNIDGSRYVDIPMSAEKYIRICPESWKLLESFTERMTRKGVAVYFANTPYVETSTLNKEKVKESSKQFTNTLSKLGPVLDDKSQLILSRKLFLDFDLHLNSEGRKLRTQMLAEAIKQNEDLSFRISK